MVDIGSVLLFMIALFLTACVPGPSIAALVSRVIVRGWRNVLPFVLAMWVGEIIWLSCAIFGLIALAEEFHLAFVIIKYLGFAYLIYLAWEMWTSPAEIQNAEDIPAASFTDWGKMFLAGLSVTLGNPKIMIFYLALLPTLIDLANISLSSWIVLMLVTTIVLASVDLTYMALAARARRLLKTPSIVRTANRIGAACMAGAAALIVTKS